jgi:hypothetical protein
MQQQVNEQLQLDDGLELEDTSTLFPEKIDHPFDPSEIKVGRKIVPISSIVQRIDHDEIDLSPDFQRRARIWDPVRKSRLIESILLRIPLPVFYVAADLEENWKVVDGLQRLTTIYDFIKSDTKNSFALKGLEYLTAYEGARFSDLPRSITRRINETELNVNVIESGTPENVMFNIFRRLNTGGVSLNSQEIRNALHPGPVRQFLMNLVDEQDFIEATGGSVRDDRMGARELALRYCAFRLSGFESYHTADMDTFLNDAMKQLNVMPNSGREEVRSDFVEAMRRAHTLFGGDAFRKRFRGQERRSPVNRALFEAISVNLSAFAPTEFQRLCVHSAELEEDLFDLMADEVFLRSISLSTGSRQAVAVRFGSILNLFRKFARD